MSRYNCSFSFYHQGVKTADVVIKDGAVTTTAYTDDKLNLPFGFVPDRNVTRATIDLFYERNCVPEHRANIKEFLDHYGLEKYDAYKICRITGGQMADSADTIEWTDGKSD
jgi:hypothetical protein